MLIYNIDRFLWAHLSTQQLLQLETESDIQPCIENIPSALEEEYDEIFIKVPELGYERFVVQHACMWVMVTPTPICERELPDAVEWSIGESKRVELDILKNLCSNILTLTKPKDGPAEWRFVHWSVAEYFEEHHCPQVTALCIAAKSCLRYLIEAPKGADLSGSEGFGNYAANTWAEHVTKYESLLTKTEAVDADLSQILYAFIGDPIHSSSHYRA